MSTPLQIVFGTMSASPFLRTRVGDETERLGHADFHAAIRDAVAAAERQIHYVMCRGSA